MSANQPGQGQPDLLARGGGNATAAGVQFQAAIGAILASHLLAGRSIDARLGLGGAKIESLHFESEAPVDDISAATTKGGWIFYQCKTNLSLSDSFESELGKTAEQIVRLREVCATGGGNLGWNRPLNADCDRIVIAVGPNTPATLKRDLASALNSNRAPSSASLTQAQGEALSRFEVLLRLAWRNALGRDASDEGIRALLRLIAVHEFDIEGADRSAAVTMLENVVDDRNAARPAYDALSKECERLMARRLGTNTASVRGSLADAGIKLLAPPDYRPDVQALRAYSAKTEGHLAEYERTFVREVDIQIDRECTNEVVNAARDGPLVLVGEPGAGKSAVVSAAAHQLRQKGNEVIELAVDQLPINSLDGLRIQLGLQHSLPHVLENWPGAGSAFLFIDALDATRGGGGEAVFRALIGDLVRQRDSRWTIIASIRTFDLRLGVQYRELFSGSPPAPKFADPAFLGVRHIHIPRWSDEEFAEILAKAPLLDAALTRGGQKLRDLARVPFNTRLVADLLSGGLNSEAFGEVGTQVELLSLYWDHRVTAQGLATEPLLRDVVAEMVTQRRLRASRVTAAGKDAAALERLLSNSVLVPESGNRDVAFRHHILFDYAASRLFLDAADIPATSALLARERGLGLMLAPALSFALQDLWVRDGDNRAQFWLAVARIAGDSSADPIARSVAARSACELPATSQDTAEFAALFSATGETQQVAFRAFSHIVGALVVRLEDKEPVTFAPWCQLAFDASGNLPDLIWPLRSLLLHLVERVKADCERAILGKASRAVLSHTLSDEKFAGSLVISGIGMVAKTYGTDPAASRRLLQRLFDPSRKKNHAHEDFPWLSREIEPISKVDPDFVVEIYKQVFGYSVDDTTTTSMGGGQILPFSSNRQQDYQGSFYSLRQSYPAFLEREPEKAVEALIGSLEGYVARKHKIRADAEEVSIDAGGRVYRFIEDDSYLWAYDPDNEHQGEANSLLQSFTARLLKATPAEAAILVNEALSKNRLGLLWARMFMVAAKRPDILGPILFPLARRPELLTADETEKDAVDLVKAYYPLLGREERESFEADVGKIEFPKSANPSNAKTHFLKKIATNIGAENLATDSLRVLIPASTRNVPELGVNPRRFTIHTTVGEPSKHWWLDDKKVDVKDPKIASLIEWHDKADALFRQQDGTDLAAAVEILRGFAGDLSGANAAGIPEVVIDYCERCLARACERVSQNTDALRTDPVSLGVLCDLVEPMLSHESPKAEPDSEAEFEKSASSSGGVRIDGAEAALLLCRIDSKIAARFLSSLNGLVRDSHPQVRLAVVDRFRFLWNTAREDMWRIANEIAEKESNRRVLAFFAVSLSNLRNADPGRVESILFKILPGAESVDISKGRDELGNVLGSFIFYLWVINGREESKVVLDRWLVDPARFENELSHAMFSARGSLVVGYDSGDAEDAIKRKRGQKFAADLVSGAASGLETSLKTINSASSEEEVKRARTFAKLLDQAGDQFYFASGAFRSSDQDEPSLENDEAKRAFLAENFTTLHQLGDVSTPHTVYHLIELLAFLAPADPGRVFDLVAHALLNAGKKHGYQFESMGADRFVEVISHFLADHRELFLGNTVRRDQLVACLEFFVEAGWPAARRLLYRLPELLQ